jgi:hypothetical protein
MDRHRQRMRPNAKTYLGVYPPRPKAGPNMGLHCMDTDMRNIDSRTSVSYPPMVHLSASQLSLVILLNGHHKRSENVWQTTFITENATFVTYYSHVTKVASPRASRKLCHWFFYSDRIQKKFTEDWASVTTLTPSPKIGYQRRTFYVT